MKKLAFVALASLLGACTSFTPADKSVSGVFKGTLPCADCEKIEATLTLNEDKSYEYHTVYYKRGQELPFTDKGTYTWDSTNRDVVRLGSSENLAVLITNDYAELSGVDGKPTGKAEYRLPKVAQ